MILWATQFGPNNKISIAKSSHYQSVVWRFECQYQQQKWHQNQFHSSQEALELNYWVKSTFFTSRTVICIHVPNGAEFHSGWRINAHICRIRPLNYCLYRNKWCYEWLNWRRMHQSLENSNMLHICFDSPHPPVKCVPPRHYCNWLMGRIAQRTGTASSTAVQYF